MKIRLKCSEIAIKEYEFGRREVVRIFGLELILEGQAYFKPLYFLTKESGSRERAFLGLEILAVLILGYRI